MTPTDNPTDKASVGGTEDAFQHAKRAISRVLSGVTQPDEADEPWNYPDKAYELIRIPLGKPRFKYVDLIQDTLKRFLGFRVWGADEKIRWVVPLSYEGHTYWVSHRKFGLRVEIFRSEARAHVDSLMNRLHKATQYAEKYWASRRSEDQLSLNITLPNHYLVLNKRYRFFRRHAIQFYARRPPPPVERTYPSGATSTLFRNPYPLRASHLAWATVSAYFSRLEHLLVLLQGFVEECVSADRLLQVINAEWEPKLSSLMRTTSADFQGMLVELRRIKARRNVETHGGFEQRDRSFLVHTPVGAVAHEASHMSNVGWYREQEFRRACEVFDKLDSEVRKVYPFGWLFITRGHDVAFDPYSKSMRAAAMGSIREFKQFILAYERWMDDHANMDY